MNCKYNVNEFMGKKFGKWTIIGSKGNDKRSRIIVRCKCDCGKEKDVLLDNILRGRSNSCLSCAMKKHGQHDTRLYNVWKGIKRRCYNKNDKNYPMYGDKGIIMCDDWKNDFMNFYNWAYNNGFDDNLPSKDCIIDRINSDGIYEPSNCRWINSYTRSRNQDKSTRNTSGYIGVSKRPSRYKARPWKAAICVNYKTVNLGNYATQREALEARNKYIVDNKLENHVQEYIGELDNIKVVKKKGLFDWFKIWK